MILITILNFYHLAEKRFVYRKAGYFNSVKVSSGIDVFLVQGNKESIQVEADDNLMEYIMTEIDGNTLKVWSEANIRQAKSKRVYVSMKDVSSLSATSAGDIVGDSKITTEDLYLSASSAGDIDLEIEVRTLTCKLSSAGDMSLSGNTDELEADLSSAGDLNAYDLKARVAVVSTSSSGSAKIFVTEKLKARASSAGDIHFKGDPQEVDGHSSSAGSIRKK